MTKRNAKGACRKERISFVLQQNYIHVCLGKLKILRLLQRPEVKELSTIFYDSNATQDEIGEAGKQLMIKMQVIF